jgi:hypothetical protein
VTMWEGVGSLWTHHSAVPLGTAGGARPAVETSTGLLRVAHVATAPPLPPRCECAARARALPLYQYYCIRTHVPTHAKAAASACTTAMRPDGNDSARHEPSTPHKP